MKKWMIPSIIVILLSTIVFQYFKIKRYEHQLVNTYEISVHRGESFGQYSALRYINEALESINKEDQMELVKNLGRVLESFSVAENSYVFMGPYIESRNRQNIQFYNYMSWFYRDLTSYVYNTINIAQERGIDKIKLKTELTELKEGLEFIESKMTISLLREETLNEIDLTWDETIKKILIDYPEQPGFRMFREKYYRDLR